MSILRLKKYIYIINILDRLSSLRYRPATWFQQLWTFCVPQKILQYSKASPTKRTTTHPRFSVTRPEIVSCIVAPYATASTSTTMSLVSKSADERQDPSLSPSTCSLLPSFFYSNLFSTSTISLRTFNQLNFRDLLVLNENLQLLEFFKFPKNFLMEYCYIFTQIYLNFVAIQIIIIKIFISGLGPFNNFIRPIHGSGVKNLSLSREFKNSFTTPNHSLSNTQIINPTYN